MRADFLGDEPADRGMAEAKAIPLPRHRRDTEKVTEHHRVRPRMGDPEDPSTGRSHIPQRQLGLRPSDATRGEKSDQSGVNSGLEITGGFPPGQTFPPFVVMDLRLRQIGIPGDFSRLAVPIRLAAFLQPRVLFRVDAIPSSERCGGLTSPQERRHQEFIKGLA